MSESKVQVEFGRWRVMVPHVTVTIPKQPEATRDFIPDHYEALPANDGRQVLFKNGAAIGFL